MNIDQQTINRQITELIIGDSQMGNNIQWWTDSFLNDSDNPRDITFDTFPAVHFENMNIENP